MNDVKDALVALRNDHDRHGETWRRAHELAQRNEGVVLYDRLHALVHRIEGDEANARYWYRRAGEPVFDGAVIEEIERLLESLS